MFLSKDRLYVPPCNYYGIETFVDKSLSSFGAPTGVTFSPSEYAGVYAGVVCG